MLLELKPNDCLSTTDDNLNPTRIQNFWLSSNTKFGFRLLRCLLRAHETLAQITFDVSLRPIFRQTIARSATGPSY